MVVNGVTQIELPSYRKNAEPSAEITLPCFVAGPENRLAAVAVKQLLSDKPLDASPQFFNPLVFTGPTGSGKSHLARGIARHFHQLLGKESVEYFTAIDFGRQLHAAREGGELQLFRQRLANLSLLIVEDLQRLPQRAFVQRELRDTLEALVDTERVVLLTAQQPPIAMGKLETGLRDRLACGLTVQLRPPGMEARRTLLQLAATSRSVPLPPDQLENLVKKTEGPAPCLLRALAELELTNETEQATAPARPPLQLKQIIAVVARYYSLTQAALRSPARRKSLVHARGVAIHLARKLTHLSYAQIGQGLGRRDHTTIMHAQRSIEQLLASDASTQQDVDQLYHLLTAV